MNRYTITNDVTGKMFGITAEQFPPEGIFYAKWGDPGLKIIEDLATQQQKDDSLGIMYDYRHKPEGEKHFVTKIYYVLENNLNIVTENIDDEIIAEQQHQQDKQDAKSRLMAIDWDDNLKLEDTIDILKDLRLILFNS
ncbi:MAG: hypothetical protein ACXAC2_02575 [Candidatus Kariarchaeaceae archaeon]|jgi:hypothetical protein